MRLCKKCKIEKTEDLFGTEEYWCKQCHCDYQKIYYQQNKERVKLINKKRNGKRDFIWKFKCENECKRCGFNHPAALDFHHINPSEKLFMLSGKINGRSLDEIKLEISKCELLCRNCHAVHHFNEDSGRDVEFILDKITDIKTRVKRENVETRESLNKCLICSTLTPNKKYCSELCFSKTSNCPPKEELEELIWKIPTIHIAAQYNVSDKTIEKWSKRLGLSKPPRGYWTKKKV